MLIISYVIGLLTIYLIASKSKYSLHILQLESYSTEQYIKWIKSNKGKIFSLKIEKNQSKKPLVFTKRAKRLYVTNILINAIVVIFLSVILSAIMLSKSFIAYLIFMVICLIMYTSLYIMQPLTMALANEILLPVEKSINMGFYKKAQEKVRQREDLTVVGITGSFGKTSTKVIVGTILGEKYNVLNTPESYNTPMGLSKVINNDLNDNHDIFIAELGARNIGDIKEVSDLVGPKIGILTSIGATHIETFKNIDNIMKTKYELIEALPTDGIAIFNYDNEHIKKLADKTFKEKILYGLEGVENLDIYAENIEASENGSRFILKDKEGNSIECKTKLLGKHNIYNILAGVAVARLMNMSFEEIKDGIEKIQPIPHRLDIIDSGNGLIVIDDAFNSNPIGAKAALEVLSQFKEGRKIVVTPGMVELGAMEQEANKEFGVNIGKVCDYVILVGEKRTKPIYDGLMEVGYNKDSIFVVNNLTEATKYIQKIAKPKDVVLFENDLPDNYSE